MPDSDVHAHLPDAEIRPPVRRGDLYTARLLRYSAFVILDGVFAQSEAISPREVVDVLDDGAAVIGGASMGALRAVDCAPAGAEGVGLVWRLFAQGVLNSEDEVAVMFLPERAFPAVTQALVTMRVALRRAVRAGHLSPELARMAVETAQRMHYTDRTWPAVFAELGQEVPSATRAFLSDIDIKRTDAEATLRRAALRQAQDPTWVQRARASRGTFSLLDQGRAHDTDPYMGQDPSTMAPGFLFWMAATGRAGADAAQTLKMIRLARGLDLAPRLDRLSWADLGPDQLALVGAHDALKSRLDETGRFTAEMLRFGAVARWSRASFLGASAVQTSDLTQIRTRLAHAHGLADWSEICLTWHEDRIEDLDQICQIWARALAHKRAESKE